jgi:hypothetical protein
MNDAFARLVDPFFRYVIGLQRRFDEPAAGHPALVAVQGELVRLVQSARESAWSCDRPGDFTDLAEYALVYWADEVLINSRWAHAGQWLAQGLLEDRLYGIPVGGAIGGHDFYAKAALARLRSRDAFEVFFLCVALGFQGQYAPDAGRRARWPGAGAADPLPLELRRWVAEAHAEVRPRLSKFLGDDPGTGDDDAPPGALPGRTLLLRASVLTAVTVLGTLAAWIVTEHLR